MLEPKHPTSLIGLRCFLFTFLVVVPSLATGFLLSTTSMVGSSTTKFSSLADLSLSLSSKLILIALSPL